jgi:catechol 2,3-dioxygenase-like lactoylglutathione lyase family enzyme
LGAKATLVGALWGAHLRRRKIGPGWKGAARMIKLAGIGHVNFRVSDQDRSKRFYTEVLGFRVSEEDPVHGGIFLTLGEDFHTIDVSDGRGRMVGQPRTPGLSHVAFRVDSIPALREAYRSLLEHGIEIDRAIDHVSQRSIYFRDPDGIQLEIYYEVPEALRLFQDGRGDEDVPLPVSRPGEPVPEWLFEDDWPNAEVLQRMLARRDANVAG